MNMVPLFVFSLTALALSGFTFLFFFRYIKKHTGAERVLAEFRDEIEGMITEINEATVRDENLVEARVKKLRGLLEGADRRIAAFERRIATFDREISRRGVEEAVYLSPELFNPAPEPEEAPEPQPEDGGAEKTEAGDSGAEKPSGDNAAGELFPPESSAETGREAPAAPPAVVVNRRGEDRPPEAPSGYQDILLIRRADRQIAPKPKPFAEQAAELHREGLSSSMIASKLGVTVTEVELAITLAERGAVRE